MKFFLIIVMMFSLSIEGYSQFKYPNTKIADSSSTYWGVTIKDPYRWLEDVKLPEVESWYKEQNDFTNAILNKISGRDELVAEYKRLDTYLPSKLTLICSEANRIFYNKITPGEIVPKVYYRESIEGKEQLLFDPTTYITGKTFAVKGLLPSYDGKKLVIWFDEGGSEICTIRVLNVDTKEFLPDSIYPSSFGAISWSFDNTGFTYFVQKTDDKTKQDFALNTKTRYHKLGEDIKNDLDFFSKESYPNLGFEASEIPYAGFNSYSKKYVFADLFSSKSEMYTYYANMDGASYNKYEWKILCKVSDKIVRSRIIINEDVYAISGKNAENYKLVHTTLLKPDWDKAEVIVAEKKDKTLEQTILCGGFLVLSYNDGTLLKYNLKTKALSEVKTPIKGTLALSCIDRKKNTCIVNITSWCKPSTEFQLNIETNLFVSSPFNKPAVFPEEYSELVAEEVEVKGHDGVMIPLTIIYKKGLNKNGGNICLMEGYGAYGYSFKPAFNKTNLPLVAKYNIVFAIPHVRGGSEKGASWHEGGFKTSKPNTWKDFISCAEYLIANGYTSSSKLAGTGTSAGGIMITRAITERPDLLAAAICNVGSANMLRYEFTPTGASNVPEFGTIKDSVEFRALYEMDALQHVVKGTKYPAVICVGAWNDPRVAAWQAGKFVAALQNATSSNNPALLKVNFNNGHFSDEKEKNFLNFADQFSFVLWQCGHPDFKLKRTP
jgi:prolyl oligopeptidase